jgi:hypothetical protein
MLGVFSESHIGVAFGRDARGVTVFVHGGAVVVGFAVFQFYRFAADGAEWSERYRGICHTLSPCGRFGRQQSIKNAPDCKTESLIGAEAKLRLDDGFIHEHDRNIVSHGIDPVALGALQAFGSFAVFQRLLASRANQNLQEFWGDHDWNCSGMAGIE